RLMRALTATGFVAEVGEQMYAATPVTKEIAKVSVQTGDRYLSVYMVSTSIRSKNYHS
ncbi:MAG: hypothetical protein Q9187_005436, partial [Circinaria calcarea]